MARNSPTASTQKFSNRLHLRLASKAVTVIGVVGSPEAGETQNSTPVEKGPSQRCKTVLTGKGTETHLKAAPAY